MPDPILKFKENTEEAIRLVELHEEKTGVGPGRRAGVEILNKSGIVMLTACWEAFIEDTAAEAFEFLLAEATDHKSIPKGILRKVADRLKEDKNDLKIWDLAGAGWKDVLRNYKTEMLHAHIGFFNTPRAGNIDTLFSELLDCHKVSTHWHWNRMSAEAAKLKLSDYIKLRGSIAHRLKAENPVLKDDVDGYSKFIVRLGVRTSNVIRDHIQTITGKFPWDGTYLGKFY